MSSTKNKKTNKTNRQNKFDLQLLGKIIEYVESFEKSGKPLPGALFPIHAWLMDTPNIPKEIETQAKKDFTKRLKRLNSYGNK